MYDLRGFGVAQDAPPVQSARQLADDLATLLDRLSIPAADVYGISYGGAVALQFAVEHPLRVRSVAVLGSVLKGSAALEEHALNAERSDVGTEPEVAPCIAAWFFVEAIARDAWEVRYARACIRRACVKQWAATWRAMAEAVANGAYVEMDPGTHMMPLSQSEALVGILLDFRLAVETGTWRKGEKKGPV